MEFDPSSELMARVQAQVRSCGQRAQAAAEGLPAGFGHADDVIVLLQPIRVGSAAEQQTELESTLRRLADKNFLTGTQVVGVGGVLGALVSGVGGWGFHAELTETEGESAEEALFGERSGRALVSARPKAHVPLANFVERGGYFTAEAIARVTAGDIRIRWMGVTVYPPPPG